MREQAWVCKHFNKHPHSINPWRVIILDDCINEAGKDPTLVKLATQGRHFGLCVMITDQHPQLLATAVRSNSDVCVIFNVHEEYALQTLAHNYTPQLDEKVAVRFLQQYCVKDDRTKEAQCLVIVNRYGNTLADRVFFLTAPDPGRFRIGCKEYWEGKDTTQTLKDELDLFESDSSSDSDTDNGDGDDDAPGGRLEEDNDDVDLSKTKAFH